MRPDRTGKPSRQFRRMTAAEAFSGAFDEQGGLTEQDRIMIALLAEHGVLTGPQLARLAGYTSASTARHRLSCTASACWPGSATTSGPAPRRTATPSAWSARPCTPPPPASEPPPPRGWPNVHCGSPSPRAGT